MGIQAQHRQIFDVSKETRKSKLLCEIQIWRCQKCISNSLNSRVGQILSEGLLFAISGQNPENPSSPNPLQAFEEGPPQKGGAPPACAFLLLKRDWLVTRANQSTEARRGWASLTKEKVDEQSSNSIRGTGMRLTDFNYILFYSLTFI